MGKKYKRTDTITLTSKVRMMDYESIRFARAAARACDIYDMDIMRMAYADILRKCRDILESSGRWESFVNEYTQKRSETTFKPSANPSRSEPNPRPPQIFEG